MKNKHFLIKIIVFLYTLFALTFVSEGVTIYYHIVDAFFILSFVVSVFFYKKIKRGVGVYVNVIFFFSCNLLLSYLWSPILFEAFQKNVLLQSSLLINSIVLFVMVRDFKALKAVQLGYLVYVLLNVLVYFNVLSSSYFSPLAEEQIYGIPRFRGVSHNSNLLAMDLFFSSFVLLILRKFEQRKILNMLYSVFLVLIFVMILASGSKKGIISYILLQLFYFYFYGDKRVRNLRSMFTRLVLFISPILFFYLYENFMKDSVVFERIFNAVEVFLSGNGADESTEIRLDLYSLAYEGILNEPITGNGLDSFAFFHYYYSHSNFLEILFNLGFVGFVLYYRLFYKFYNLFRKNIEYKYIGFFLLIVLLFVDLSLVSYNLRSYMIFFTFLNILLIEKKDEKKEVVIYK